MSLLDEAWCVRAIELFHADPDAAQAARGWTGDVGLVVHRDHSETGILLAAPVGGRLHPPRMLPPSELQTHSPTYFAQASEADWRALIEGRLDPIAAIVQKRLIARGDLTQVVARLKYRGLAERWLARLRAEL